MTSGQLQLPCLGRPFHLGMLYDSGSETLIPGKSLWDAKALESNMQKRPKPYSNFEVIANDTLQKKSASLGLDANLKLSFMGGLVKVEGAAEYINDRTSSEQQARVTLKYTSTTRFEELSMEHLGSIQYPEVFDDNDATHVVSAVLYGADAYFVFDRQISSGEKTLDVQGKMEAIIKEIPGISDISGKASIKMKEGDKKKVEKFSCTFYGDLLLPSNPSTFEDAVQVYKDLPILLGNKGEDKSVPKVVYLYPLHKLDGRPQQIIRSIKNSLVSKLESVFEVLHGVEMKVNDFKCSEVCLKFDDLNMQMNCFLSLISQFKMDLVKKVSGLLPQIRRNGIEETSLADLLSEVYNSPFSPPSIETYIKNKDKEFKLFTTYLKNLSITSKCIECYPSSESNVIALTTDAQYEYVVCFAFNVTSKDTPYLKNMEEHLQGNIAKHVGKEWYEDKNTFRNIKLESSKFIEFVQNNLDKEDVAFAITDICEDVSGPGMVLYVDSLPEAFQPPGVPLNFHATSGGHDRINLSWSIPKEGAERIESYKIIHSEHETFSSSSIGTIKAPHVSGIIKNLKPKTKYFIKIQAVTKIGTSSASNAASATTKVFKLKRPAEKMLPLSELLQTGSPSIYSLPLQKVFDHDLGLYKYNIGTPSWYNEKPEKVLMVVGATGAGKSTLINGMANYILGVEWNDPFRFKVICDAGEANKSHAHSQTQHITAYSFHCTNQDYILTIVDTPGFGDTNGIAKDKEIAKKIKEFFSIPGSIDHINGISFVTQASLARLTPTQKYIF